MAKGGPIGGGGPLLIGYPKGTTLAKKAAPKKVAGYAPKKSVAPAYTSKAETRSSGMEVNPSTGSTSRRGATTSSGASRGRNPMPGSVINKATGQVISAGKKAAASKAGPRLSTAQKNKLRVDIRNKGAQGRASHQTPAEKGADPQNWAKIAADLGNVGDKRFRGARTGAKASPAARRYAQATGRGRGSKPQKAK